jgi:hypothetical protein
MAEVVEVSETETTIIKLPAEISLSYEFKNPFKSTVSGRTKFTIDVKIYVTNTEAEALDRELLDVMLQALNTIFEAKKLAQEIEATEETFKEVFDTDPA